VTSDPNRFTAAIDQAPWQDFSVGQGHAPHLPKRAVEAAVHVAGVLVIPRITCRPKICEPVHGTIRLRAAKCDDQRVAAFGNEPLRVLVVEKVESAVKPLTFAHLAQRSGVSYATADAWANI
jgi:hypothetical protein